MATLHASESQITTLMGDFTKNWLTHRTCPKLALPQVYVHFSLFFTPLILATSFSQQIEIH